MKLSINVRHLVVRRLVLPLLRTRLRRHRVAQVLRSIAIAVGGSLADCSRQFELLPVEVNFAAFRRNLVLDLVPQSGRTALQEPWPVCR